MSRESLKKAVMLAKTQTNLVELMKPHLPPELRRGFRQGHISNWLHRERKSPVPPAEYVPAIVAALDGEMQAHDLRPDLFPVDQENVA